MTYNDYQKLALKTSKIYEDNMHNMLHMVLGITSEYFEALEADQIQHSFTGLIDDHIKLTENLEKELGDVLWYTAGLAHFGNFRFGEPQGYAKIEMSKVIELLNSLIKAGWVYNRDMESPDKSGYSPNQQLQWCIDNIIAWVMSYPFNINNIMEMNINKLKARYPESFNEDAANNRKSGDV